HLRCYHLTPDGAGYKVVRDDLVTSTDNWFRPSDVCVAPDGSVFIADWYDPGVGGHGMGDTTRGRVYRVAPKGHKYRVPQVDLQSVKGMVNALRSPALSVRYLATEKILSSKNVDEMVGQLAEEIMRQKDVAPHLVAWSVARLSWFGTYGSAMIGTSDVYSRPDVLAAARDGFELQGTRFLSNKYSDLSELGAALEAIRTRMSQTTPSLRREVLLA